MSVIGRGRTAIQRHGMGGALGQAAKRAGSQLALSESHVWYALDLSTERPARELEAGLTLRRGTADELSGLGEVQTNDAAEMAARLDAGNHLWLVLDGDQPLFATWIFRERAPVAAAHRGQLVLPADTVCMEDSESAAAARGRGIAPAAISQLSAALAAEGIAWLITKVDAENESAHKAVEKGGYEAAAMMHFRRRGRTTSVTIEPIAGAHATIVGDRLAEALERGRTRRSGVASQATAY
jgi:GNAT superfamily N-acetyltransferase